MKRYNPTREILSAICAIDNGERVRAYFRDGRQGIYSAYMEAFLATDPNVTYITSETTGEILYIGED